MPSNCRLKGVTGAEPGGLGGVKGEGAEVEEVKWEMGEVDRAAGAWLEVERGRGVGGGERGSATWERGSGKEDLRRWQGRGGT